MIVSWLKKSALLLPLIAAEGAKLSAEQTPLPEISTAKSFSLEQPRANSAKALVGLSPTLVAYEGGFLSNYKTEPGIINCPKRNFTKEELKEEIKNKWFGYRWYRNGKFHLSNADQIKHAHNHCNMSPENYRKLFVRYEHDKSETFLGKVCRAYIPPDPKGKPMYVLVLGHAEKLNDSPDESGVIATYDRLVREKKGIVLMFMTGSILDEVDNALALKCRFTEHKVLYAHMERNLKDFIDEWNPSKIGFLGNSWGGGAIVLLAKNNWWQGNVPVRSSVVTDAINLGAENLATPCRERPSFKDSLQHNHYHIYQRKDGIHPLRIQGDYPQKIKYYHRIPVGFEKDWREGDIYLRIPNTTHPRLHNLPEVRRLIYLYLTKD